MTSVTPTRSSFSARGALDSVMKRLPRIRPAMPTGRLIRKIGRHSSPNRFHSVSSAPSSGPETAPSPTIAPNRPNTLPRSCAGEGRVHDRQHLRHHHRGHPALEDARGDQHLRVRREAAQRGGEREAADADEEQPLATVDVTQPSAGDQPGGEGERVTGRYPLDLAEGSARVPLDRRNRDIDDRDVDEVHEGRRHHDREGEPATPVTRAGRPQGRRVPRRLRRLRRLPWLRAPGCPQRFRWRSCLEARTPLGQIVS